MRNVILNLAKTYDGYISRLDGSVDYLNDITEDMLPQLNEFLLKIEVVIMGRNTYDEYNHYGWDYLKGKRIIVLSSRPALTNDVEFYSGDLTELVNSLDCGIWCFGGTKVIKSFLEAELIDVFNITTVPVIIGKGKRLFEPGDYSFQLDLLKTESIGNMVTSTYKVKKKL